MIQVTEKTILFPNLQAETEREFRDDLATVRQLLGEATNRKAIRRTLREYIDLRTEHEELKAQTGDAAKTIRKLQDALTRAEARAAAFRELIDNEEQ